MMDLHDLDGLGGLAALVNSLILWPIIRALKRNDSRQADGHRNHERRIRKLERG